MFEKRDVPTLIAEASGEAWKQTPGPSEVRLASTKSSSNGGGADLHLAPLMVGRSTIRHPCRAVHLGHRPLVPAGAGNEGLKGNVGEA